VTDLVEQPVLFELMVGQEVGRAFAEHGIGDCALRAIPNGECSRNVIPVRVEGLRDLIQHDSSFMEQVGVAIEAKKLDTAIDSSLHDA
jgi:hypothetical protein